MRKKNQFPVISILLLYKSQTVYIWIWQQMLTFLLLGILITFPHKPKH